MHIFVILSFVMLALTGMMLKFAGMPWAKTLANLLGGVEVAGVMHRIGAAVTFGYFFAHIFSMIRKKIKNKTIGWLILLDKKFKLHFTRIKYLFIFWVR